MSYPSLYHGSDRSRSQGRARGVRRWARVVQRGDYATAITYWRDAYRRDCTAHALLLNLARAFELKGDRAEAVNVARDILCSASPTHPMRIRSGAASRT